jgi:hypothetical protein
MDNNAKTCYDCIICNLAMIVSQYFGVSSTAAQMQETTLKRMCFRICTAVGDSSNFYSHSTTTPVHGIGQGSCASPAIWLLISSILMDCLSKLGNGLAMKDVMETKFSMESLRQWIDGFVDDTSLFTNIALSLGNTNDIVELTRILREDMIAWKDLLETSRGKLEVKKCFYYILNWKFDGRGNPTPTTIAEQ